VRVEKMPMVYLARKMEKAQPVAMDRSDECHRR
jgi:hypothetical protein